MLPADELQLTITEEGVSVLSFFAHDNSGNYEEANTLTIRLDKTPPAITAVTNPVANSKGWHKDDVTVTFSASDELSGLAAASSPDLVTEEGEAHDQIFEIECFVEGRNIKQTSTGTSRRKAEQSVAKKVLDMIINE